MIAILDPPASGRRMVGEGNASAYGSTLRTSALLPPKGADPGPHDFFPANGPLPGGPRRGP